jgi:uncharacterized membrane protein YhfC
MEPIVRLLDAGLMIGLPLSLGLVVARRYGVGWVLFGWGAVTFIGSQVVHLPLLHALTLAFRDVTGPTVRTHALLVDAVILGLAAGVCEEGARYVGYRYLAPGARRWEQGVMLGIGHGGTEAIVLGLIAALAAVRIMAGAPGPAEPGSPLAPLLGAVERLFAITNHLALSVMVLQVFVRRSLLWLAAAVGWHAVLDGSTVYFASRLPALTLEAVLGGFALVALAVLVALRPRQGRP